MSVLSEREVQAIKDVCVSLGLALKELHYNDGEIKERFLDVGSNICELIEAVCEE